MSGKRQRCTASRCDRKPVARRLCAKHYQAAWKAGELGAHAKAAGYGERPAVACPPGHVHGATGTCYVHHKCRCGECRQGQSARNRERKKAQAYGRYDSGLVDATEAREHVLMLSEHGIGYKRTARLAGVGVTAVRNLVWGRQDPGPRFGEIPKRVKQETAEAILAVQPSLDTLADATKVPAGPYVKRVKALVTLGWSQAKIAAALGMSAPNFRMVRVYEQAREKRHASRAKITAGVARQIVALYDEWSMQAPPERNQRERIAASRARRYARERGWPLPLDWEAADGDFTKNVRRSAA